jgi:hypothetical protein
MYRYCQIFGATPDEYESRPYEETKLLMEIHRTRNRVVMELEQDKKVLFD